ncbi:HAAS signaling domain-containing protein [Plantactinospora sp. WMMC1484]|uniref:HAAS signaling domain-containing protein n=1 Tax=Plantactinospora sp. WMMC1484 TaxID=3404122 RepID=UPI003BF4E9E1
MTVTEQEIARYVGQVREALADLPPSVRDELLEDLPEHLAEVAAEGEGPLHERLGPPQAYATELRTAAGVRPPAGAVNLDQRINAAVRRGRARLRAADSRLGPVLGYARLSDFLRLLRPAWWILRGYLVAMLVTAVLTGGSFGLLPRLGGSTLAALLLLAATVTGSVWLGRRTDRLGRRPRAVLHLSGALLVLFGLAGFALLDSRAGGGGAPIPYEQVYTDQYSGVQDVYVYDSEGRLLEGVRLFDQNGEPIRLGSPWCDEAWQRIQPGPDYVDPVRQPYPYCPQNAPFRIHSPSAPPAPEPAESVATPETAAPTATPSGGQATPGGGPTPTPAPTG